MASQQIICCHLFSILLLLLLLLQMKRCCCENAAGALQDYNKGEISECQSKLRTNRNVFSWCLNGTRGETVQRDGGRLFHARGAATGKARSPRVDLCTLHRRNDKRCFCGRWRLSTSAVRRMFSARYAGAGPLKQRCVSTQRRNVIRSGTRSQVILD